MWKRDTNILKANLNVLTPDAGDKTFSDFDIDERKFARKKELQAIGGMGWQKPTKVQEALVPLALEGKSVISRARTGSGKTGAYLIPIISKVVDHISVRFLCFDEGCLPDIDQLTQYLITCLDDHERFSILVAMFKLKLIVGKTIIFVNDINRCYLTSLLLRAFGLKACVLNSSMPANSRFYVIDQYNRNTFEIVIASDAVDTLGNDTGHTKELSHRDKEAGVSRGIDFNHVSNVVNLDFPTSTDIYIHRVGRTARGGSRGTALSICTPTERVYLEAISKDINEQLGKNVMIPYEIRVGELDSFLLRVKEVLSKCGKSVIKAARMHEIRLEVRTSLLSLNCMKRIS
ncbi:helicase protein [Dictyocaulus viviparus]|uniref:RNA helicase n=1 Tax=Dictyocaulus viviparus TaxID=29172 RepID=A0A0D8Y5B4_DICVI|nr:helicase protein [Dictyocaulus viviparus]